MKLVIRIPLVVQNMHALAGFYTDGPSMMAVYGLVSNLEREAQFEAKGFGLVVEKYASSLTSHLKTGSDPDPKPKQGKMLSMTGYRHADLVAALYLELDALESDAAEDLVDRLADAVNASRFQGGHIIEWVAADSTQAQGIRFKSIQDELDLADFIFESERPLSTVYASSHLDTPMSGDALLDAFAEALLSKDNYLVCNGYAVAGEAVDSQGNHHLIADPTYTLVHGIPAHKLKKVEMAGQEAFLQNFFWSFDADAHTRNPSQFTLK